MEQKLFVIVPPTFFGKRSRMIKRLFLSIAIAGIVLVPIFPAPVHADTQIMNIPVVKQYPELPNGCEITSLAAAMKSLGIGASKMDLAKNYLPMQGFYYVNRKLYAPNPYQYYIGTPWGQGGWYCYAPPIVTAANNYFANNGLSYQAIDYSNRSKADFEAALNNNNPIIIWVTKEVAEVRRIPKWYSPSNPNIQIVPINLHCVVLRGISQGKVYYMDPIRGNQVASVQTFFTRYNQLGSHAVMIDTNSSPLSQKILTIQYDGSVLIVNEDSISPMLSTVFDKSNWFLSVEKLAEYLEASIEIEEENFRMTSEEFSLLIDIKENKFVLNDKEQLLERNTLLYKEKYYVSVPEVEKNLNLLFMR